MSTQVLTKEISLENRRYEHISVKDEIFRGYKIHAISVDYDETSNNKSVLKQTMTSHGLAAAILHAYNHHQHLRLTPDDIWLTIAQGVSRHINYNAEKFRSRFVKHEGKKKIEICLDDILYRKDSLLQGEWPAAIELLTVETDRAVEKIDIKPLLECDFSTTTKTSLTASRIVLLDMVKAYFTFEGFMTCCGIPKVTLEGTLEDWTKLQEKVIQLRQLDLDMDFWLDRLDPVVWKLVETYKGEIDEEFWARIASRQRYGSGCSGEIDGWMMAFYPYAENGKKVTYNELLPSDIPTGRVEVPFTVNMIGLNFKFNLTLAAGFLGAKQETLENSDELVVSPVIGWFVIDDKTASESKPKINDIH